MIVNGYKEYEPPVNLRQYLVCYWSYFIQSATIVEQSKPIIPDGCLDVIFDLNCPARLSSFVIGAMTKPILNTKTNLIGVRFKPGRAYSFLKIPVHEITDQIVAYNEFAGGSEDSLAGQLAEINSTNQQISLLNQVFTQKLTGLALVGPQVSRAIKLITQANNQYNIKQLGDQVGWTRQHFTRECLKHIGLSPKFFSQVSRVKKIISAFQTKKFHDWSQLAIDGGYYDQSHMINEFKKITGLTPKKYLARW